MRARHVLLALCVLALAGGPLFARGGRESRVEFEPEIGVRVVARTAWPGLLSKGWLPVWVEAENTSDRVRELEVELRMGDWQWDSRSWRALVLQPGQRSSFELYAPLRPQRNNGYSLVCRTSGSTTWGSASLLDSAIASPEHHAVLYLCGDEPEAGALERWSADTSTAEVGVASRPGLIRSVHVPTIVVTPGTPAPAPPGGTPDNILFGSAHFDELPTRSMGYTSLDAVLVDTRAGWPSREQAAPLIEWVALGGTLLIVGPRATEWIESEPALKSWYEPRFERANVASTLGAPHMLGQGTLFAADVAWPSAPAREALQWACTSGSGLAYDEAGWRLSNLFPEIPGLALFPVKSLSVLLILFALAIGPLNFWLIKRTGRPVWLLVSIPAIALVAALGFLAYGLLHQGIALRTAEGSFSVLDQRDHRVWQVAQAQVWVGLGFTAGIEPAPGTTLQVLPDRAARVASGWSDPGELLLRADWTDGLFLSGDYLPVRRARHHQVLSTRASRSRIALTPESGGLRLENSLGTPIRRLVLHAEDGRWWSIEGELDVDRAAAMVELVGGQGPGGAEQLFDTWTMTSFSELPRGSYVAEVAVDVFGDDLGLDPREERGAHFLFGVLETTGGSR